MKTDKLEKLITSGLPIKAAPNDNRAREVEHASRESLRAICGVAAQERGRYALNCVEVECDGKSAARLTATDGRRLASRVFTCADATKGTWLVNASAFDAAVAATAAKRFRFGWHPDGLVLADTYGAVLLPWDVDAGQFPDWRAFMPDARRQETVITLAENGIEQLQTLARMAEISNDNDPPFIRVAVVEAAAEAATITLTHKRIGLTIASTVDVMAVSGQPGTNVRFGVNPAYLVDVIRAMRVRDDSNVMIGVGGKDNPIRVTSTGAYPTEIGIVMPVDL